MRASPAPDCRPFPMLYLLSPAKRLDYERPVPPEVATLATRPQYMDDAAELIEVMRAKTPVQVARLWGIQALGRPSLPTRRFGKSGPQARRRNTGRNFGLSIQ